MYRLAIYLCVIKYLQPSKATKSDTYNIPKEF